MRTFIKNDIGMAFFGIGYHFGSINEHIRRRGCSHLMEHLVYKTNKEFFSTMTRMGINSNAYTSDDRIVFHFSGLEEQIKEMGTVLMNGILYQTPMWTKEAFEMEKKVVLQEYGDSFNTQESAVYYNLLRTHYDYSSPIGFKSDVEKFTWEDSKEFAIKFRKPNQLVLVASSDFLPPVDFGTTHSAPNFNFQEDSGLTLEPVPKEDKTVVGLLGIDTLKTYDLQELAAFDMTVDCLTADIESPLYQEIREKRGLSYFSAGMVQTMGDLSIPFFYSTTSNERGEELSDVYTEFFSGNPGRWITKDRFEDVKQGILIREKKNNILPHSGLGPKLLNSITGFEGISKVTHEDVLTYASLMSLEKMRLFSN